MYILIVMRLVWHLKKKKVFPQEAQPLESKNKYIILVSLLIQSDHFLLLAQIIIVRFYEILFLK